MNKIAFVTAALGLMVGILGCDSATIGASATLDTDLHQTLIGPLDNHTVTFVIDLDRDGLSDVLTFNFDSQAVSYDPNPAADPAVTFLGDRPHFQVYYGRSGGFGRERSNRSADAVFVVGDGEMIEALGAADVDGDGLDELLVYTISAAHHAVAWEGVSDPVGDAVYVVHPTERLRGQVSLPDNARRVATPERNREWYERRSPLADLDGGPGLELAYLEDYADDSALERRQDIVIRDMENGALVATLSPREGESLWLRSVQDLDADGVGDVICHYTRTIDAGLVEHGLSVSYGPFDGDRTLGDPGTELLLGGIAPWGPIVSGNYVGDADVDALVLHENRLFVLRGGPRTDYPQLSDRWEPLTGTDALFDSDVLFDARVAFAPDRDGDGYDEIVGQSGDLLHLLDPSGEARTTIGIRSTGVNLLQVEFGGTGDVDGDGLLDLVLGSFYNSGRRSSGFVISGFGG